MKSVPLIIVVFSLCWVVVSAEVFLDIKSAFERSPSIPLLLLICCLSSWTQTFISKYNLIPIKFLILLYSFAVVLVAHSAWNIPRKGNIDFMCINPFLLNVFYFSLVVSNMSFSNDKYLFFNTLPTVLYISIIITAIEVVCHASIVKLALLPNWTWLECGLLAVIFSSTQSHFIVHLLNDQKFKKLKAQMNGESLIAPAFIFIFFDIGVALFFDYEERYGKTTLIILYKIIVGLLSGYILGIFTTFIITLSADDSDACAVTTLSMLIASYILMEHTAASPLFCMLSMGLVLMQYREHMMEDNVAKIARFFELLYYIGNFGIFAYSIFVIISMRVQYDWPLKPAILNYLMSVISRVFAFGISYPILKWLTPTFNCQQLLLMIWAKVISNTTLIMNVTLLFFDETRDYAMEMLNLVFISALLTHSVNSISFVCFAKSRLLMRKSMSQITSILNTLNYIYQQKNRCVSTWKMKSLMADVRWDMVNVLTTIKQPFKKEDTYPINDQLQELAPKRATCPDCNRVITAELSIKDKSDMKIEATRRILKEMNMHLEKLFSMGFISLECELTAKKMILESDSIIINISELNSYFKSNKVLEGMKRFYSAMVKFHEKSVQMPRKPFRRICYKIVMNRYYRGIMLFMTVASIYPILVFVVTQSHNTFYYSAVVTNIFFALLFLFHIVISVYAYSFVYVMDGLKTYFSSYWHIFDLIIVTMAIVDISINAIFITLKLPVEWSSTLYYSRLIRLVVILKMFEGQMLNFLKLFEDFVDVRVAFGFELIKSFTCCYDEVLMLLNKIIVNNYDLEMECRESLEKGRWAVLELVLQIQLEKPWVAVSVKTKHIMNALVKAMNTTLTDLKISGFLDDYEYKKLRNIIKLVNKKRSAMNKKIKIGVQEIFSSIPWITMDQNILEFIKDCAIVVNFIKNTTICREDDHLDGIYIIVSGVLKIEYTPKVSTINQLLNFGRLPIVDFIESNFFDRYRYELVLPGNAIGELSFLTNRPYDSTITAMDDATAVFLDNDVLIEANDRNPDMIDGLVGRMWKSTIYEMCMWIMGSVHTFENFSISEKKQKLERSFVPNLAGFRTFHLNSEIEDLILIDGQIVNLVVKEVYNAPCYIPRTVTSFSIVYNEETNMNAVILIIPMPDADIKLLMAKLQETANLATESDTDFKRRFSKLGIYRSLLGKDDMKNYHNSSFFNPLEMLKLSRK